jgi:hypothetical protein
MPLAAGNRGRRLYPRRVAWLLFASAFYFPFELATWGGLEIDELVYCGYRRQEVGNPVLLLSDPCSGTMLLHRCEKTFLTSATMYLGA